MTIAITRLTFRRPRSLTATRHGRELHSEATRYMMMRSIR